MATTDAPREREDEQRARRRQARAQQQRRRQAMRVRYLIGGVVALALLLGGGGYLAFAHGNSRHTAVNSAPNLPTLAPGTAVDGISCQAENVTYHIHVALTLYRNGQPVVLPAGIGHAIVGGQSGCLYWLHTHSFDNAVGIVHIESPTARIYTLGQFLDIWHYDALWGAWNDDGSAIAVDGSFEQALRTASGASIHVYADGQPVSPNSYRAIPLTAHKSITIELGAPLRKPAAHVTFPEGE